MEEEKISIEPEKIDTAEEQPPEEQKEKKGRNVGKYKKNDTADVQPPEEQKEKKGKKRGKYKKIENDTAEELDFNAFKAFFLGS
jgi:hypothetical protein